GPTYATGPQALGKRISELDPDAATGEFGATAARPLIEYDGVGNATVVGLAAGPDGLYFTDLYKDVGATSPIDRGANLLRVRYVAEPAGYPRPRGATPLRVSLVPVHSACTSPNS